MGKLPISVCIIAKNEEKHIENCLKRLKPLGVEIVLVDTGSVDKTKDIALKYISKVYDFEWIDDFSAARNYAVSKATNNWVLTLDCDEYIDKFDGKKLMLYIQQFPKNVGLIDMTTVQTLPSGDKTYHTEVLPRFYNRKYYEYKFRIHEQITPKNVEDNNIVIYSFKMPVSATHHGYDIDNIGIIRKQERNLSLLQKSLGEVRGHDDYLYYQIGQSYNIMKRTDEAYEAYRRCFEINKDKNKSFIPEALLAVARIMIKRNETKELIGLYVKYKDVLNSATHFYYLALAYEKEGYIDDACMLYNNLIQMPDIDSLGEKVYEIYIKIISICQQKNDFDTQKRYLQKLVEYGKKHGKEVIVD